MQEKLFIHYSLFTHIMTVILKLPLSFIVSSLQILVTVIQNLSLSFSSKSPQTFYTSNNTHTDTVPVIYFKLTTDFSNKTKTVPNICCKITTGFLHL